MEPHELLAATRSAIADATRRLAELIRPLPALDQPIPDSEWTAREAVAHLVTGLDLYTELATGTPSPIPDFAASAFAEDANRRIADVSEADPAKLAYLLDDAAERFVSTLTGRAGGEPVTWHAGIELDLVALSGLMLGEVILHGYDIAVACGRPWPFQPEEVALVIGAYGPCFGYTVDVDRARGLTVAFGIEIRGVAGFVVRFDDGRYSLEPEGSGPVDCTISADPGAFLLVTAGRLARWPAISLGLLQAGGNRPELAVGFKDLFVFP